MKISEAFEAAKNDNRRVLIPYLTAGYPDEETFLKLMETFAEAGAGIVEVGIPFSDPLADGPTIQASSQAALDSGVTLAGSLAMLGQLRDFSLPIVIMSYLNPLLHYGLTRFARDAARVGVRGLIVPDIICEEGDEVERACEKSGIDLIYLIAPTSSSARRKMILKRSRGFVYLVSLKGVTGARRALPSGLSGWISDIKRQSKLPVAVGFGISSPQIARTVSRNADGVIVGSALLDIIRNAKDKKDAIGRAGQFVRKLVRAIDFSPAKGKSVRRVL